MTGVIPNLSLVMIALTWLAGWRVGLRWTQRCGVYERAGAWVLACVLPTVALVSAVQVLAFVALATDARPVTPPLVALLFLMLIVAATMLLARRQHDLPQPSQNLTAQPPSEPLGLWWMPVIAVACTYLVFFVDAITRFPSGVDGLHYHLPVAVEWMRAGRLDLVVGLKHQSFPENGMIVPALLLAAKLEGLANIAHFSKAIVVALAVFSLCRAIGADRRASIFTACIALFIPMVLFQSVSSYIDLYAATSWLTALLAIVWASKVAGDTNRTALYVMAGLSAGVALGSKTTFLVLVPLLALVAIASPWLRGSPLRADRLRTDRSSPRIPRPLRIAIVFGLACLPCSLFWFVRGAVQAGNPVYPLAIEVGGEKILPGFTAEESPHFPHRSPGEKLARWWNYPWRETKHSGRGYPYSVNNALGAPFTAFVPLGMIAAAIGLVRRRRWESRHRWVAAYLLLTVAGGVLMFTVFNEMLRFVLPCILVAVALSCLLTQRLMASYPRATLAMAALAFATTAAIAGLRPAHALAGRLRDNVWDRTTLYEIPPMIDDLPPGSRVLNLASPYATYPLLGDSLDLRVVTPLQWEMLTGDGRVTTQALYEHHIDYVYTRASTRVNLPDNLPGVVLYDDDRRSHPLPGCPRKLIEVLQVSEPDPAIAANVTEERASR